MQNLPIIDSNGDSPQVFVGRSWVGLLMGKSPIKASVCGDCGYTELYTEKHAELLEEWRKRNA